MKSCSISLFFSSREWACQHYKRLV